jgi:hypothetical protein
MLCESNPDGHGLRTAVSAAINSPFRYQFAVSASCNERYGIRLDSQSQGYR